LKKASFANLLAYSRLYPLSPRMRSDQENDTSDLDYQITMPFEVLEALAILTGTFAKYLFDKARKFNNQMI
jgi:hypothetical protein